MVYFRLLPLAFWLDVGPCFWISNPLDDPVYVPPLPREADLTAAKDDKKEKCKRTREKNRIIKVSGLGGGGSVNLAFLLGSYRVF